MRSASPVSRPAWFGVMNALTGTGGVSRKSPAEMLADAAARVTRSSYAEVTGLRDGRLGRWTDGVAALRADRMEFAAYWAEHNDRLLAARGSALERGDSTDPLWVVLGDSTGQGIGAPGPWNGYVGQTLWQLRRATGTRWQVLNLSVSGALMRDVLVGQVPWLEGERPDLITCGAGANDILYSAPARLLRDLRALLAAVPEGTVMLDLPLLNGFWGVVGRMSVPYIGRINRVIVQAATARGLRVAEVSRHFVPPWTGKFSADNFHPSQDGYRDWSTAIIEALDAGRAAAAA